MEYAYIVAEGCPTVTPRQAPPTYTPEGDFSVITIGTSCPETTLGRSFPSTLVHYKGEYFLVDVGEGTNTRLAQGGILGEKINHVFFTHHHADHDAGYAYFAIDSWMKGRKKMVMVGPPRTKAFHEMAVTYYDDDLIYRSKREGVSLDPMLKPEIYECEDKGTFDFAGVHITTAKLTHTDHNIGYRFEADGKVIVVSGDTSYDPALIELAKDADILVMDSGPLAVTQYIGASRPSPEGVPPVPPSKNPSACAVRPHPGKGDVAKMAIAANVKAIVITHYPPMGIDEEATRAQFRSQGYEGEVILSRDLVEYIPE